GVLIYGIYEDKIALIRQFRYPLGTYVYEFPAGLVEEGEDVKSAAVREAKEETGLDLEVIDAGGYERPFFTSTGLTDETCATIFGILSGTPSTENQEKSEDIQVVLADKEECRRILNEENVAIMTAYMLMHFINDEKPFGFLEKRI
ncbi:MAG: NUDIX hydrolase, partial [Firmicutes bacterium]|nr:NUDIX hydrolase [Bacillota bacterium]